MQQKFQQSKTGGNGRYDALTPGQDNDGNDSENLGDGDDMDLDDEWQLLSNRKLIGAP